MINSFKHKGDRNGIGANNANGDWRLTFEFSNGNTYVLAHEDCH